MNEGPITVIQAGAVRDAAGVNARPGAVAVRGGRVVYAGEPGGAPPGTTRIDRPGELVLPALVNAHTHLELTSIGPQPHDGDFIDWVRMLIDRRPRGAEAVAAAVGQGVDQLRAAGVGAVGDIGGGRFDDGAGWSVLKRSAITGVAFHEVLGYEGPRGDLERQALRDRLDGERRCGGLRLGVQPHAPYTTSRGIYDTCTRAAADAGLSLATHLAELREEAEFVAQARGPFRRYLERIDYWDPRIEPDYTGGLSPVQWMKPYLERAPWLLAHCNYLSDDDITILAAAGASVAYCPTASEYFGHRGHRYRDLLNAGVNVCLGTDSIVCQPPDEPQPLGVLPQMRRLHRRDRAAPDLLLRMATVNGMTGLRMDGDDAVLRPGAPARLASVRFNPDDAADPLEQVLLSDELMQTLET